MCGIYALYSRAQADVAPAARAMARALRHRGPDASGTFECAGGVLGHHRLSIIDLDARANQPFRSDDGRLALSFNGEIYNFIELREELRALGAGFRTTSDTEVVLRAFERWGPACFARLNGDFALLIHDEARRAVWGARDRLGVKPFFYSMDSRDALFASELKGLLSAPGRRWTLNERLAYRYLAADFPDPDAMDETFVDEARSIKAAHWFKLDLERWTLVQTPYWTLDPQPRDLGEVEAARLFRETLEDAVRIRTRADVPLGAFLSAGLDSSSICALAAKFKPGLPTFSSVFPGSPVDESAGIDLLARHLGLPSHKTALDPRSFAADLEMLVRLQDQPFMTLNVYSQYKNLEFARNAGMKVMLDGGGGDEILAGYADYKLSAPPSGSRVVPWISEAWRRRFGKDGQDRPAPTNFEGSLHGSRLRHALRESVLRAWLNKSVSWDDRYLDLSGMALGVEVRVPFQDHRVVELALSLPPDLLLKGDETKRVLRLAVRDLLPAPIVEQRRKIGFEFPFCDLYAKDAGFRGVFEALLPEAERLPAVDAAAFRQTLAAISAGRSNDYNVWRPFNLALWLKAYGVN
jgi:asparagine synthase (glutamine-hydrolysing)